MLQCSCSRNVSMLANEGSIDNRVDRRTFRDAVVRVNDHCSHGHVRAKDGREVCVSAAYTRIRNRAPRPRKLNEPCPCPQELHCLSPGTPDPWPMIPEPRTLANPARADRWGIEVLWLLTFPSRGPGRAHWSGHSRLLYKYMCPGSPRKRP